MFTFELCKPPDGAVEKSGMQLVDDMIQTFLLTQRRTKMAHVAEGLDCITAMNYRVHDHTESGYSLDDQMESHSLAFTS